MIYYIFFLILFGGYSLLVYKNRYTISKKYNLIDKPDNLKKIHKKDGFLIGGIILILLYFEIFLLDLSLIENLIVLILFISSFFIGFYDDRKILSISQRTYLLIILCIFFSTIFFYIDSSLFPLKIQMFKFINTDNFLINLLICSFLFFLVYNVLNFSDGINYSVVIFVSLFFLYINIYINFNVYNIIIIFFISIFYLILNKKMVFLGSSGILILTVLIYLNSIHLYKLFNLKIEYVFALFSILGTDLVRLFFERIFTKKKPWLGDRNHIHHLLNYLFKNDLAVALYLNILSFTPIIIMHEYGISLKLTIYIGVFLYLLTFLFVKISLKNKINKS